ncbi:MAG TPA: glucose 1-dehydrogenase [Stellaceae bacterium]|nr:glucose 1-dehydrogenase [Stellaceae bacterium]
MRLKSKVAVVTGGMSGIGAAIAERFAAEGAEVVAADLACADAGLVGTGTPRLYRHKLDVTDINSIERVMAAVLSRFQRVDVLVNSAGIAANKPFLDTPVELFDRIIAVNLRGIFLMSQAVARTMMEGGGSIINISSVSGLRGNLGRAAYGASKGGLITLSEVMAVELAASKIRVNVIAPGPIRTPLIEALTTPAEQTIWTKRLPLGRYGTADEVAAAALFLASDEASFITGHVLAVDGGFLASGVIETSPKN